MGRGSRGETSTIVLLKEHGKQWLLVIFCSTHRPCLSQPSSEKLLLAVTGNKYRDPQPEMCREWETWEESALNGMSPSTPLPLLPLFTPNPGARGAMQKRRFENYKSQRNEWLQGSHIFLMQQDRFTNELAETGACARFKPSWSPSAERMKWTPSPICNQEVTQLTSICKGKK